MGIVDAAVTLDEEKTVADDLGTLYFVTWYLVDSLREVDIGGDGQSQGSVSAHEVRQTEIGTEGTHRDGFLTARVDEHAVLIEVQHRLVRTREGLRTIERLVEQKSCSRIRGFVCQCYIFKLRAKHRIAFRPPDDIGFTGFYGSGVLEIEGQCAIGE